LLIGLAALLRERVGGPIMGAAAAIDGDSLRIGDAEIRLIGIDAPEHDQRCGTPGREYDCGRLARLFLKELAGRGVATCDPEGVDRFGRDLAICRIGDDDLARQMVAAGHAIATDAYFDEEARAKKARRGIWAGPFMLPKDWRDRLR
jgi:endonuclease YncB( thermonuclease family)